MSNLDYQFLAASAELDRREVQQALEAERIKEVEARLAQEKKTAKRQNLLLFLVSIALMIASVLGVTSYSLYCRATIREREARISEIAALVSSSEGLFASDRRLDALIAAIKAKRRLQKLRNTETQIENKVIDVLRQGVYEIDEYNRLSGHKAAVMTVDISPDSQLIASGSVDKTINCGGDMVQKWQRSRVIRRSPSVKFSPDGQFIASGGDDGTVKIWQRNGTLLKTFQGHTASIWTVAFSPDGQTIASASMDKTVKIWNKNGKLLRTLQGHTAGIPSVAFSPASAKYHRKWRQNGETLEQRRQTVKNSPGSYFCGIRSGV